MWTDWGVSPWLLNPNEKTLQFVDDVLDEVMRLFPSRYVSIGGDEADKQQWSASPEVRARMRRLGLANMDQLQGWFTSRVADHLIEHGRTPVGWDDELLAGAALPTSEVVMSWHDDAGERVALEAIRQGHDVILNPQGSLYFDHYQSDLPDETPGQPPVVALRQAYDTAIVPEGATAAEAATSSAYRPICGRSSCRLSHATSTLCSRASPRCRSLGGRRRAHMTGTVSCSASPRSSARYRALGIGYADTAFAPGLDVTEGPQGMLRVALANQASFGNFRYTTDGSVPSSAPHSMSVHWSFPRETK